METLLIIDTSSYLHKAYHGFGIRYKKNWTAIGMASYFKKLVDYYQPKYVLSAEDNIDNAFLRRELYPKYKSNRKGKSESDMNFEFETAKMFLQSTNVKRISLNGYEADDVIAEVVHKFKGKVKIIIVTGDKDMSQLVDSENDVEVHLNNGRGRGFLKYEELIHESDVIEKYGTSPSRIPELFGLIGDVSDGIPGVSGMHEDAAIRLINTYGNLERIYDNINEIEESHIRAALKGGKEMAFKSRQLATPLPVNIDDTLGGFKYTWQDHIVSIYKGSTDIDEPQILKIFGLEGFDFTTVRKYSAYYNLLTSANNTYYRTGLSAMSDEEFDKMLKDMSALEKRTGFTHPNSPTIHVGTSTSLGKVVKHSIPMLSLDNTYNEVELQKFVQNVQKDYVGVNLKFEVEWKWDGISLSLEYEKGRLIRALTRGDGISGNDVTENAKMLQGVPYTLSDPTFTDVVRGEAIIKDFDFVKINEDRTKSGLDTFANPRNAASIISSGKDPNDVKNRCIGFIAYKIMNSKNNSDDDKNTLKDLGFNVEHGTLEVITGELTVKSAAKMIAQYETERVHVGYPTDGLVVSTINKKVRAELGDGVKYPRWAKAFKFNPQGAHTKLKGITWQVGKYGTLTPVAEVEPVHVAGSTISRATLHNFGQICEKNIKIGDTINIVKSAEVIPKVLGVAFTSEDSVEVKAPKVCPVCGGDVEEDGASLKCVNTECPDRIKAALKYITSKAVLDIEGFGPSNIEYFYNKGLRNISEILDPNNTFFEGMEHEDGYGESTKNALMKAIQDVRDGVELYRLLAALTIEGTGVTISKKIAECNTVESILSGNIEFNPTIGPVAKSAILDGLLSPEGLINFKSLITHVRVKNTLNRRKSNKFAGKSFCISGNLPSTKDKIETLVRENGGIMASGVSKNLSYLICQDLSNSKPQKAKALGVRILSYSDFTDLLK